MQVNIELIYFHASDIIDIKTCENMKLFYRDMFEYDVLKYTNFCFKLYLVNLSGYMYYF